MIPAWLRFPALSMQLQGVNRSTTTWASKGTATGVKYLQSPTLIANLTNGLSSPYPNGSMNRKTQIGRPLGRRLSPLQFPFTDLAARKVRPAVVVADVGMDDWILCQMTSRRNRRLDDIAVTQQDMQTGRLRAASWVRPGRLHTLNGSLLGRTVGQMTAQKMEEIRAAIRGLF